jgi:hypothetical protein
MKRALILILILTCVASLTLLAGCGDNAADNKDGNGVSVTEDDGNVSGDVGEQVEITDENGQKITVEESQEEGQDGGTVTLEGEGGEQSTIEVQDQIPSEEALGAPIYPGAQYIENSGVSGKTTQEGQEITMTGASFTTADTITKVVDWYKLRLGEPMTSAPETTTWMFKDQEGAIIMVTVELPENKVEITIAKVTGDIDIGM